jgi:hypothetical protein
MTELKYIFVVLTYSGGGGDALTGVFRKSETDITKCEIMFLKETMCPELTDLIHYAIDRRPIEGVNHAEEFENAFLRYLKSGDGYKLMFGFDAVSDAFEGWEKVGQGYYESMRTIIINVS